MLELLTFPQSILLLLLLLHNHYLHSHFPAVFILLLDNSYSFICVQSLSKVRCRTFLFEDDPRRRTSTHCTPHFKVIILLYS